MLFDVKNTAIKVPFEQAYAYIANAQNLPQWTNAFASVESDGQALMTTEQGQVPIKLEVVGDKSQGTIDWKMTFPDNLEAIAHSRVVPLSEESSAYSFLLTPPPAPLEMLEVALAQQAKTLEQELITLKNILENAA